MASNSHIEWKDATWNPVTGCTQLSPGCDHCYALTFAERFRGVPGHPYEQGFDLKLWPERLELPFRWKRPRRIFVNSMSDLFHDAVPTGFISDVFETMAATPQHTYTTAGTYTVALTVTDDRGGAMALWRIARCNPLTRVRKTMPTYKAALSAFDKLPAVQEGMTAAARVFGRFKIDTALTGLAFLACCSRRRTASRRS